MRSRLIQFTDAAAKELMPPPPRPFNGAAPAPKSVLDLAKVSCLPRNLYRLAKVLRLPQNLYLSLQNCLRLYSTMRKCRGCHEIRTQPCESAAPATKSPLDLAKILRLRRNLHPAKSVPDLARVLRLYLTMRKCRGCHEIRTPPCESAATAAKSVPDLANVLRLRRNLRLTLRKYRACHEVCTQPCKSSAPATKSVPDLTKVLRLTKSYSTLRKCRACNEICA